MPTTNLGRIGFVNKGTYNPATAYKKNDIVIYGNNNVYAAILPSTGQLLTNTAYWENWINSSLLAPLSSPALTDMPTAPTAPAGTNTDQLATTKFVNSNFVVALFEDKVMLKQWSNQEEDTYAQIVSGIKTFSTSPIIPNGMLGTHPVNKSQLDLKAPLSSPAFTDIPTAPTAPAGTNTTQLATTGFATTADNLRTKKSEIAYNNDTPAFIPNTLASGAIIENGSNANGSYIKYADGTLICSGSGNATITVVAPVVNALMGDFPLATFPIAFVGTIPTVITYGGITAIQSWGGTDRAGIAPSLTQFRPKVFGWGAASGSIICFYSYVAIGKWK